MLTFESHWKVAKCSHSSRFKSHGFHKTWFRICMFLLAFLILWDCYSSIPWSHQMFRSEMFWDGYRKNATCTYAVCQMILLDAQVPGGNATYCAYYGVVIAFKHGTCTSSFTICFPECWLLTAHAFKLSVYRIYMHIHPFANPLGLVAQSFTECIRMPRFTRKHLNIEPTGLCVCVFKHWLTYSQFLQEYLLYIYISLQGTRFSEEYCSLASHLTCNSICLQERNPNLPRMDAVQ